MSDVYVVVDIATTCDESSNYITPDSTELIEFAWSAIDATTLSLLHQESILIRPTNTPITPYCAKLNKISWEHVKLSGGSFKDAIVKFDKFIQLEILSKNLQFSFVTWDVSKLRVQLPREARDKLVVLPPYLQHPRVFDLQNEYVKWQLTHPEALSYTSSSLLNVITALEVELEKDEKDVVNPPLQGYMLSASVDLSSSIGSIISGSPSPEDTNGAVGMTVNADGSSVSVGGSGSGSGSDSASTGITSATLLSSIYSKFLTQLIKKSMPIDDHPLVLTKPLDSAQDVKIFLSERSKILYISNLPHDTTQSELESWFTQYGGRPIAFWTLKSLDEKSSSSASSAPGSAPTGSAGSIGGANGGSFTGSAAPTPGSSKSITGFAVFATHEEATESLAMNGRLLNDRSIEVQASSTKVLDKASDLLTPFPPSKNRPRPGDWTCPSCGFSNFQRRTACFRCSFPAASAVAIQESIYSNGPKKSNEKLPITNNNNSNTYDNQGNGHGNNQANNNNNHSNHNHNHNHNHSHNHNNGYINFSNNNNNNSNATSNINNNNNNNNSNNNNVGYSSSNTSYNNLNINNLMLNQGMQNGQQGSHNSNQNGNSRSYGNNVPFRAGDWKCEACFYHNFAKNLCCLKCGNNKPNNTNSNNNSNNSNGNNNNNNNNNNINNSNNNSSSNNNNHNGYVNSTAAAIAAATASGQPLNNGYIGGTQHSQPNMYSNGNKGMNSKNMLNNNGKNGNSGKQFVPQQYQKHLSKSNPNLRGGSSTPKPLLQQHLMMFQQQQQQGGNVYMGSPQNSLYSQSVTNSPALYDAYSNQYSDGGNNGGSTPLTTSVDNRLDGLSNQVQSLNLNN